MYISCNTEHVIPEYLFTFRTRHEYAAYLNGLKAYAEKIPGKYRHKLVDIIVKFDAASEPYDGSGVVTRLYGDEALYFFRLVSTAVAVLNLVEEEEKRRE